MKEKTQNIVINPLRHLARRMPDIVRFGATSCILLAAVFLSWQTTQAQPGEPDRTLEADVPFEMLAPWFRNPKTRTELVDEVVLRGTLHITMRIWQSDPGHIDRFALHANAVGIKGTSETTGQRYRLGGSFSYDLRDPEVTFNPDGTFTVPDQPFTLRMHMVDPEPAKLTSSVGGFASATGASVDHTPPPPVPCERVIAPDGTPTASVYCGTMTFSYVATPLPNIYQVLSSGGDACVPGTTCVVPDGATLFNGYTGGYETPLVVHTKANQQVSYGSSPAARSARTFCQTGERTPLISNAAPSAAGFFGSCRPIFSATEPIKVWAEVSYQYYRWIQSQNRSELVTLVVSERPFTFRFDERPMDQPPTVTTFSVLAASRINGRCAVGQICELIDGDVIYNTQVGDYERDLLLSVTASDPEGDPIVVEWFCQAGAFFAPITNQSGGIARCTAGYIYPDAIQIYARVSDGNNSVWTSQRLLYMLEFLQ